MSLADLNDELMNGPKQNRPHRALRIAVDLDGTLHNPFDREKGYKMGKPMPGAAEAIRQLRLQGHEIIIFPTWADTEQGRQAIVDWLTYFGIEFDDITSTKPEADLYIDNNGYRFTDWENALAFIKNMK